MDIKVSTVDGRVPVTVVHVDGDIDSATSEAFSTKVDELIAGGARYILLDLVHAPFISSAGLRVLHAVYNKLRELHPDANLSDEQVKKGIREGTYKSPHLKLLKLSKEARKTFELSGYDMYIETFEDEKTAVAAF
jgi:anti-anti-sigma factor